MRRTLLTSGMAILLVILFLKRDIMTRLERRPFEIMSELVMMEGEGKWRAYRKS